MSIGSIIELAFGLLLIALGVWRYRRRGADGHGDTQGAVLLFAAGALLIIHSLGVMTRIRDSWL